MGTIIKDPRERRADRAQKLLAKASRTASPAEREVALAKAARLLAGSSREVEVQTRPAVPTVTPAASADVAAGHIMAVCPDPTYGPQWLCVRCGGIAVQVGAEAQACSSSGWCGTAVHRTCDGLYREQVCWLWDWRLIPWQEGPHLLQEAPRLVLPDGRTAFARVPSPEAVALAGSCGTLPKAQPARQQRETRDGRRIILRHMRLEFWALPELGGGWGLYDARLVRVTTSGGPAAGYATADEAAEAVRG